jgi:hypothetical protein
MIALRLVAGCRTHLMTSLFRMLWTARPRSASAVRLRLVQPCQVQVQRAHRRRSFVWRRTLVVLSASSPPWHRKVLMHHSLGLPRPARTTPPTKSMAHLRLLQYTWQWGHLLRQDVTFELRGLKLRRGVGTRLNTLSCRRAFWTRTCGSSVTRLSVLRLAMVLRLKALPL